MAIKKEGRGKTPLIVLSSLPLVRLVCTELGREAPRNKIYSAEDEFWFVQRANCDVLRKLPHRGTSFGL